MGQAPRSSVWLVQRKTCASEHSEANKPSDSLLPLEKGMISRPQGLGSPLWEVQPCVLETSEVGTACGNAYSLAAHVHILKACGMVL